MKALVLRAWPILVSALVLSTVARASAPAAGDLELTRLVEAIRQADYRGRREDLGRLAGELGRLDLPDRAAYQDYWVGFAWWRRAINGFNEAPRPADLLADLERCEASERKALSKDPAFEDALAGLANCLGMQLYLSSSLPPDSRAAILARGGDDLMRLRGLKEATTNPRILWVLAGWEAAGASADLSRSIETLVRGLTLARLESRQAREPWVPAWGEAELLMSLSYLYAIPGRAQKPVARGFAEAALFLVPHWHYVADILLPQIEALPDPSPTPKP